MKLFPYNETRAENAESMCYIVYICLKQCFSNRGPRIDPGGPQIFHGCYDIRHLKNKTTTIRIGVPALYNCIRLFEKS